MSTTTLYENYLTTVNKSADGDYITVKTTGFISNDENKKLLIDLLKVMEESKVQKYIFDMTDSENAGLGEMQDWIFNEWVPKAIAAGYKYNATVLPKDIFTMLGLKELGVEDTSGEAAAVDSPIVSKSFDSIEGAIVWIKSIK